jgi:hypothetical protein
MVVKTIGIPLLFRGRKTYVINGYVSKLTVSSSGQKFKNFKIIFKKPLKTPSPSINPKNSSQNRGLYP